MEYSLSALHALFSGKIPQESVPLSPKMGSKPPTTDQLSAASAAKTVQRPDQSVTSLNMVPGKGKSKDEVMNDVLLRYWPSTSSITPYRHPGACTDAAPKVTGEALKKEILAAARKETFGIVEDDDLMKAVLHTLNAACSKRLKGTRDRDWLQEHHLPRKTDSGCMTLFRVKVFHEPGENVQISLEWPFLKKIDCGTKSVSEAVKKLSKLTEEPSSPVTSDAAASETALPTAGTVGDGSPSFFLAGPVGFIMAGPVGSIMAGPAESIMAAGPAGPIHAVFVAATGRILLGPYSGSMSY